MKISKKIIIIGSVLLTICIVTGIILIKANKNKKEDLIANNIEEVETEALDITSEQDNNNEIDNEISNIVNNNEIQEIDKNESLGIEEKKTSDEKKTDNGVNTKQETKVETPNKTITTNNSSNKTNNQSSNTNQNIESSKQQETVTETKVPEKTTEPETKPSTPQVESNPVEEKQEELKPVETKPSRTYKINTTYINKLKQTVITEVTNNLDKLNKYGITSVEQYKIIDNDSSMCTFNGGYRSGWTYENPSAYATFKASILKGTSIKIYAVDEYQDGVYIQTLCYYGH